MENIYSNKKLTKKQLFNKIIVANSIFFTLCSIFVILVTINNINSSNNSLPLLFLFGSFVSFCCCFFEWFISSENGNNLFIANKLFLFFYKIFLFIILELSMLLFKKIFVVILSIIIFTSIFYLCVINIFKKIQYEYFVINYECYIKKNKATDISKNKILFGVYLSICILSLVWLLVQIGLWIKTNKVNISNLSLSITIMVISFIVSLLYLKICKTKSK